MANNSPSGRPKNAETLLSRWPEVEPDLRSQGLQEDLGVSDGLEELIETFGVGHRLGHLIGSDLAELPTKTTHAARQRKGKVEGTLIGAYEVTHGLRCVGFKV